MDGVSDLAVALRNCHAVCTHHSNVAVDALMAGIPVYSPYGVASVLAEAESLVHGDRGEDYGHPIDDFTRTGRLWGAILGIDDVAPHLVGLCMAGLKISREVNGHKLDNLVDLAGYAETVAMVRARAGVEVEGC